MASGIVDVHNPNAQDSDIPRDAILAQLERILVSRQFRNSRHYPALLRYVVEQTLEGNTSQLKERMLGVEVFGRDPSYDTSQDPVVRTSACEVRKRLAQYYHKSGQEREIRIDLPTGSYVPEFRLPRPVATATAPAAPEVAPEPVPAVVIPAPAIAKPRRSRRYLAAAAAIVALAGMVATYYWLSPTALERFWRPLWGPSGSVMLCVNDTAPAVPAEGDPPAGQPFDPSILNLLTDRMMFEDAVAMTRLAGLVRAHHKDYDIRRARDTSLDDLRKTPVVLIGAFNNAWTMRLEARQRFAFEFDENTRAFVLRDRQKPNRIIGKRESGTPYSQMPEDVALVSRFLDPLSETMVLVVAGLGKAGTMAASEFVTTPKYLDALARRAPAGWGHKNLQVVIATTLVNGNPGAPRIVDTYFW